MSSLAKVDRFDKDLRQSFLSDPLISSIRDDAKVEYDKTDDRSAGATAELSSSNSDSDEAEDEENKSFEEESNQEILEMSTNARAIAELTLEGFWDIFNQSRSELYRQRSEDGQQSSSTVHLNLQPRVFPRAAGSVFELNRKSRSRVEDHDDDERRPKRGRIETALPGDKLENARFSCPYRKHNRSRYNIHTHRTCALSWFPTIARVKWVSSSRV